MSKKEKMSGKKLEKISGGWDEIEHEWVQLLNEKLNENKIKRCQFCGKLFQPRKDLLYYGGKDIDGGGKDVDGRYAYFVNTCFHCKAKYPFEDKENWPSKINSLIDTSKNIK